MSADAAHAEHLRELLGDAQAEAAALATLRELHDAIGRAAGADAELTVALLSLLPDLPQSERARDFYGDAVEHAGAVMRELLAAQAAAAELLEVAGRRADALLERGTQYAVLVPTCATPHPYLRFSCNREPGHDGHHTGIGPEGRLHW